MPFCGGVIREGLGLPWHDGGVARSSGGRSLANICYASCTYYYGKCCWIDSRSVAETVRHLIDPCNSHAVIPLGPVAQIAPASCLLNSPGYSSMLFYRFGPAPTFALFTAQLMRKGLSEDVAMLSKPCACWSDAGPDSDLDSHGSLHDRTPSECLQRAVPGAYSSSVN